jgi:hypothetical protein
MHDKANDEKDAVITRIDKDRYREKRGKETVRKGGMEIEIDRWINRQERDETD